MTASDLITAIFILGVLGIVGLWVLLTRRLSEDDQLATKLAGARLIATSGAIDLSFFRARSTTGFSRIVAATGSQLIRVHVTDKRGERVTMLNLVQTQVNTTIGAAVFFDDATTRQLAALLRSAEHHVLGVREAMILIADIHSALGSRVVGEVGCVQPRFVEAPEPKGSSRSSKSPRDCCVLLLRTTGPYQIGLSFGHRGIMRSVFNAAEAGALADLLDHAAEFPSGLDVHSPPPPRPQL